jgi:hypothetical protein
MSMLVEMANTELGSGMILVGCFEVPLHRFLIVLFSTFLTKNGVCDDRGGGTAFAIFLIKFINFFFFFLVMIVCGRSTKCQAKSRTQTKAFSNSAFMPGTHKQTKSKKIKNKTIIIKK